MSQAVQTAAARSACLMFALWLKSGNRVRAEECLVHLVSYLVSR